MSTNFRDSGAPCKLVACTSWQRCALTRGFPHDKAPVHVFYSPFKCIITYTASSCSGIGIDLLYYGFQEQLMLSLSTYMSFS